MPIIRTLPPREREEIREHRDNTSKTLVKCYTLRQLSLMDGIDTRTIKTSGRYLPVRVDTTSSLSQFKAGRTKKPY